MGCCGAKAGAGIDDEVKNKTLIDKAKTPSSSAPLEDEQGGNDDDRDPPRLEEEDEDDLIGLRAVEPLRPVSPAALRSPTKASAMPVPLSPSPSPKVQSASTDKDAEQVQEAPQSPLTKSPIWGRLLPQSPSASTPKASLVAASPISPKATTQEGTPRDEDLVDEVEEEAVATPASVSAVVESDDGVKAFLAALELGVVVVKHDRKGKSKKRELYTADMVTFSWREPSSGTKKPGHERARSGGGMFEKDRAHYYFEDILEVSDSLSGGGRYRYAWRLCHGVDNVLSSYEPNGYASTIKQVSLYSVSSNSCCSMCIGAPWDDAGPTEQQGRDRHPRPARRLRPQRLLQIFQPHAQGQEVRKGPSDNRYHRG